VRRLAVAAAAIGAAWFLYYALTFRSLHVFMAVLDHCPETFCDFVRHYLPMGRHVFDGRGPVTGFLYSPFFALLLAPLAKLPDGAALLVWGVLQVLLAVGLLVVPLARPRRPSLVAACVYVALFFSAHALLHNFKWGQVSVPLTLGVLAALAARQRGHAVAAGVLLAVAASVKFYPAVFALVPLLRRDGRMLAAFAATCLILLVALPWTLLGWEETIRLYAGVASQLRTDLDRLAADPNSQSLQGVLGRLGSRERGVWSAMAAGEELLRWGGLAAVLGGVWVSLRREGDDGTTAFMLLFCALPLLTPTSWPHYFVHLPAAFLVLLTELPRRPLARGAVLALLVAAAALSSILCWRVMGSRLAYAYWGMPFWANTLTMVALLTLLGASRSRSAADVARPAAP
jgi:alpha-1,2-mannosyltransferase